MSSETGKIRHPSEEMIEAWADHQLEAKAAEQVEQHFETCSFCRELAEDLRAFDQLGAAEELGEGDVEKSLGELRRRILVAEAEIVATRAPAAQAEKEAAVILPFVAAPTPRQAGASRRSFFSAWAAAALAALIGSGLVLERQQEVLRLEKQVATLAVANEELKADLHRPLANPLILELRPEGDPLRGVPESVPKAGGLTVVLNGDLPFPEGPWRAVISADKSASLESTSLEIEGLQSFAGTLRFSLPPGALPPGNYRIRLIAEDGKAWPEVFPLPVSS